MQITSLEVLQGPKQNSDRPNAVFANIVPLRPQNTDMEIYNNYLKQVNELIAKGETKLSAHRRAYNSLSKEHQKIFNKQVEQISTQELATANNSSGQKCPPFNNNIIVNNNSHVAVDNLLPETSLVANTNGTIVKFKNNTKKLSADFIDREVKKFIANNQIPDSIFRSRKTIDDLVEEVKYHVNNCNLEKVSSDLHALNAAKAMLLAGAWSTPKKFIWARTQGSLARERQAKQEKQQELLQARYFMHNLQGANYG